MKIKGGKTHIIKDVYLQEIFRELNVTQRIHIKAVIPTFKPINEDCIGWMDITKACGFEEHTLKGGVTVAFLSLKVRDETYVKEDSYCTFLLPDGLEWETRHIRFKVKHGKLWRRLK